jgi:hypothetical protein
MELIGKRQEGKRAEPELRRRERKGKGVATIRMELNGMGWDPTGGGTEWR